MQSEPGFAGIEITYTNVAQAGSSGPGAVVESDLTWGLLFKTNGAYTTPFYGTDLYRRFLPKTPFVADPTTSDHLYTLTPSVEHTVHEYEYAVINGKTHICKVTQFRSSTINTDPAPADAKVVEQYGYTDLGSGRIVATSHTNMHEETTLYAFTLDPTGMFHEKMTVTDPWGTVSEFTFDDRYRVLNAEVTPTDDFNGRPRAHDPDSQLLGSNAVAEPAYIEWSYEYGPTACSCGAPTKYISPTGRETTYTWESKTGKLLSITEPNPSNEPGAPSTVTTEYEWTWNPAQGAIDGTPVLRKKTTSKEGSTTKLTITHAHSWEPRPSGFGDRQNQVVTTTSPVSLVDGSTAILTSTATYDDNGFLESLVDFDGVSTHIDYWPTGLPSRIIVGSAAAEKATSEFDYDGWGRPLAIRTNHGTPHEQLTTFESSVDGDITRRRRMVDGVEHDRFVFYDRWGNLAVVRERNLDSAGGMPLAHGTTATARDYTHEELHFEGDRLIRSYVDRRSLAATDGGATYDDPNAWLLRRDYLYRPDGLVTTILESNDSTTELTHDGYGTFYKAISTDGTNSVLHQKVFVNGELEPIHLFRGDSSLPLWTKLTRGSAGQVIEVELPALAGPTPPGYTGTAAGVLTKYVLDYRGQVLDLKSYEAGLTGAPIRAHSEYEYDQLGRLHKTTEHAIKDVTPLGVSREVLRLYQGLDQTVRIDYPGGRYATFAYDTLGRVVQVADSNSPTANTTQREFWPNSTFLKQRRRSVWEDAAIDTDVTRTFVEEYTWDGIGRLKTVSNLGDGSSTPLVDSFSYYSTGFTESHTDPAGKVQRFLPDALGRLVEHVRLTSGTDVIHNTATFTDWSTAGRTTIERRQELTAPQSPRSTITHYDFAGRRSVLMNPGAATEPTPASPHQPFSWLYTYDAASRVKHIYDGQGIDTELFYNGLGQLISRDIGASLANAPGAAQLFSTTRELLIRDPLGFIRTAGSVRVDGTDETLYNLEFLEPDTLGRNHVENFHFGIFGAPSFHPVTSSYSLDTDFRSHLTYSSGLELEFTPDPIGRLRTIDMTVPGANKRLLAEYGHIDSRIRYRKAWYTKGVAATTEHEFDDWGRPTALTHSASTASLPSFEYKIDAAGNLVKEKYDKAGGTSAGTGDRFAYDEFDRLHEGWIGVDDASMGFTNPDVHAPPLDEQTSTYITKLTYDLDAAGNRTNVASKPGSGTSSNTPYVAQESSNPQGASNRYESVGNASYVYDERGNLVSDGDLVLYYDMRNRLSEVWRIENEQQAQSGGGSTAGAMAPSTTASTAAFPLDQFHCVAAARQTAIGQINDIGALAHSCPTANVTTAIPSPPSQQPSSPTTLTGTGGGTQQQSSSWNLVLVAGYVYDPFNRRVTKVVVGEEARYFTYDDWREAEELKLLGGIANVVDKQFVWGNGLNELVSYVRSDGAGEWDEYFIHGGGQDSVMRAVDESGALVEGTDYDPYGVPTTYDLSGATPVPAPSNHSTIGLEYGWKCHRVDPETGFTYMRNRYYSSSHGRFLSADPLGVWTDSVNSGSGYGYAGNAPQVNWDPFGLQTHEHHVIHQNSPHFNHDIHHEADNMALVDKDVHGKAHGNNARVPGQYNKTMDNFLNEMEANDPDAYKRFTKDPMGNLDEFSNYVDSQVKNYPLSGEPGAGPLSERSLADNQKVRDRLSKTKALLDNAVPTARGYTYKARSVHRAKMEGRYPSSRNPCPKAGGAGRGWGTVGRGASRAGRGAAGAARRAAGAATRGLYKASIILIPLAVIGDAEAVWNGEQGFFVTATSYIPGPVGWTASAGVVAGY